MVIHNNSAPGPNGGRQIEVPHHQDKTAAEAVTRPPPSNGALIGAQSTRETRAASSRGVQSRQTMNRPAPAAPRAASPGSSSNKTR